MTTVTIAATQMACSDNIEQNIDNAEKLVRQAADQGANIVLLQELFQSQYFCQVEDPKYFDLAKPLEDNPVVERFQKLAQELNVVIPLSFFEKANHAHFNAVAMIDAGGELMGLYRKSHIPHGFGYQEKFYFNPGDTGFQVWDTVFGCIGVGICWDQWFPECARSMCLQGADILLYPTAIGTELSSPADKIDSSKRWQRAMQGHSASNTMIVAASNRIGREEFGDGSLSFYGSSFITDVTGDLLVEGSKDKEEVLIATVDLEENRMERAAWGHFRDRRPELYDDIFSLDGFA